MSFFDAPLDTTTSPAPPAPAKPGRLAQLKAAAVKSWTVIWLALWSGVAAIGEALPTLLDLLSMPEASAVVQAYRPGVLPLFVFIVGIGARLRKALSED